MASFLAVEFLMKYNVETKMLLFWLDYVYGKSAPDLNTLFLNEKK